MNRLKNLELWCAPVVVLLFIVLLAVMYGWVGKMNQIGTEEREIKGPPETRIVANQKTPSYSQPINHLQTPMGIGHGQIQLTNEPPISMGIGGKNSVIQLVDTPATAYLGLKLSKTPKAERAALGIPNDIGLYVMDVVATSPADAAGFHPKDIVLQCDRQSVNSLDQIARILSLKNPGDVVKFVIINKEGQKKSLQAKLVNGPSGIRAAAATNSTWLGISVQNIDEVMKNQFGIADKNGVIISQVTPDSPAASAGLKVGDIIKRLDDVRIMDAKRFIKLIMKKKAGREITLSLLRHNRNHVVSLSPMPFPDKSVPRIPSIPPADMAVEGSWVGMDLSELTSEVVAGLSLPPNTRGIMVNDVESPPASVVGFQTGDVITAVNGTPTPGMKQFAHATRDQAGAVVDVLRGVNHLYITVPPPGYTQQGTPMNTGQKDLLQQVAQINTVPWHQAQVAITTTQPSPDASVTGMNNFSGFIILVDPLKNRYAAVNAANGNDLVEIFKQNNVGALICSQVSPVIDRQLALLGITVYPGVVGPVDHALQMYRAGNLIAAR